MARIMKIRTIPRGYVQMDGIGVPEHKPAEWFMALYNKLGNPQDGGVWSYLIRHNNVVVLITALTKGTMEYNVWVSPGYVLDAKRKRTKAINVIARRLNENKVPFVPEGEEDSLYYVVRQKNNELIKRSGLADDDIRKVMDNTMTDDEKKAVYGGLSQYMPEVKEEIINTVAELFDEGKH